VSVFDTILPNTRLKKRPGFPATIVFQQDYFPMNITLGDRQFPAKAAAPRYIKDLRLTHPLDVPLRAPYHAHLCDLDLIGHHPRRDEKLGSGISHFTVSLSQWGNREFHLHRVDGTSVNFSYTKCLEPKPSSLRDAKAAMRREVQDDILTAKWQ
jgi:hypothetical protein